MMNVVFDAVTTLYVYVTVSWYEMPCSFIVRFLRRTVRACLSNYTTSQIRWIFKLLNFWVPWKALRLWPPKQLLACQEGLFSLKTFYLSL